MAYYHSRYSRNGRKKKSKFSRFLYTILILLILAAVAVGYQLWVVIMKPNTWTQNGEPSAVYIPTGSNFEDFRAILYSNGLVINRKTFEWLARKKNLASHIYPGRYIVAPGLNNNELINLFRSGEQVPMQLVLNNIRTTEELASHLSAQLEIDSAEISRYLTDSTMTKKFGFHPETIISMFIPNTYEVYWDVSTPDLMARMYTEYNEFWTPERLEKAEQIGLTPVEVSTLASIVEKETTKNDEKPKIAGVYLNI